MTRHRRTAAREAAVQALFQAELAGTPVDRLVPEFFEHWVGEPRRTDRKWFRSLVEGVTGERENLDARIAPRLADGWSLERTDTTLLCLLRCAAWELVHCESTPARVVISEYLRVAEGFADEGETGFVNAVLDTLARETRAAEFA